MLNHFNLVFLLKSQFTSYVSYQHALFKHILTDRLFYIKDKAAQSRPLFTKSTFAHQHFLLSCEQSPHLLILKSSLLSIVSINWYSAGRRKRASCAWHELEAPIIGETESVAAHKEKLLVFFKACRWDIPLISILSTSGLFVKTFRVFDNWYNTAAPSTAHHRVSGGTIRFN